MLDDNFFALRPGKVKVIIHAPIETKGMTQEDMPMLREKVFETIQKPILDYHGVDMPQ
jgi:1-acyl-sn-glycerol-3-phosphate acyltransferase